MLTAAMALALSAPAQFQYLGYAHGQDSRPLATQAPYVTGVAINAAWIPEIGREWHAMVWRKDVPVVLRDWGTPGPAEYGASQHDYSTYYARVGNVVVGASPWVRVDDDSSVQRIERARQQWLREQGYTVLPRVFRNPAHTYAPRHASSTPSLKDSYNWHKITVPVRVRPRFEVRAGDARTEARGQIRVVTGSGEGVRVRVGGREQTQIAAR